MATPKYLSETPPNDIRLIASDLDGTLLTPEGTISDRFWPYLDQLLEAGVTFAVASGRQYPTARLLFGEYADRIAFIAENGALIADKGQIIRTSPLANPEQIIHSLRQLPTGANELGILRCTAESAFVDWDDAEFLAGSEEFFSEMKMVPDILEIDGDTLKISIWDKANRGESRAQTIKELVAPAIAVASSNRWIDVTRPDVNKGEALHTLQQRLGVLPEQTAVFGDYLNDLQMIEAAAHSFAMAKAHPEVTRKARYQAGSNADDGVLEGVRWLCGL